MEISEFVQIMVRFFYVVIALICIGVIWTVWARLKADTREGGYIRLFYTLLKLGIIIFVGYLLVRYGEDSGFFANLAKNFYSGK